MEYISILGDALVSSIKPFIKIASIVIILMISMEILKDLHIIDKLSKLMKPVTRFLGLSKDSTFPLLVGLTLGLAYGAGVIIKSSKEGNLKKKDLYLLMIFLVTCHSVIEDTLLFVVIGASGWLLLGIRIPLAIILTVIVARQMDRKNKKISKTPTST